MNSSSNILVEKTLSVSNTIDSSIEKNQIATYISTLNEKELQAYHIAEELLGMSFQIEKSNGYLQWKQNNVK